MGETIDGSAAGGEPRGLGRREVLQALVAAAASGFAVSVFAEDHLIWQHLADLARVARADARASASAAKAEFLDAHQMETLVSLADHIVPGATRAKVAPFIDQLLAVDTAENQVKFVSALGGVEGEAIARFGHPW